MRVGLIGCGNVGINAHVPAFRATEGTVIVAVADPTPERLVAARQATGLTEADAHADWQALVARPDVDAVIVATPQRFRPQIVIAAAETGKHILAEKPLALAPAAAQAMVNAARRTGVTLATVHNYVDMPVYRAIKQILDGGEIGEPEVAVLTYLGVEDRPGAATYQPGWRHRVAEAGGGVLMDMLHIVYLAGWFLGGDPVAVGAVIDRRLGAAAGDGDDVEDLALVRYDFPRGHALINLAWGVGPGGVQVMGRRGRIVQTNQGNGTHPFVPAERIFVHGAAGERDFAPEAPVGPWLAGVAADFRDAVAAGRPPRADGEAGVRVLHAVVGAYAAGALGHEVALPLAPDDPVFLRGAAGIAELALPATSRVRRRGMYGPRPAAP